MLPKKKEDGTFVTSDSATISYTKHPRPRPESPRLVLIHSLALDRSVWDSVVERLSGAGLAEILTFDCRGHGRSERKAVSYTAEWFARDLHELLAHVGWSDATVAGCSMGGCVALAFAGAFPHQVRGLGLIDTTAWYGEGAAKAFRDRAEAAREKGMQGLAEFQATRWFSDAFRERSPELLQRTTAVFLANDFDCYAASCALLGAVDVRAVLPTIRVPTTIIVGEDDYATPVSMAQYLHEHIAGSKMQVVTKARHLTPIECPERVALELTSLVQRASAPRPAGSGTGA